MASPVPRFLCDEMLAGLGRWLRIAGYDTAIAGRGCRDRHLVAQARAEGRVLLTRDRRLIDIRGAPDHAVVLSSDGIDACADELRQRLAVNWQLAPLSRCTLCNAMLQPADHRLRDRLPPRLREIGAVTVCPDCGRVYWEGSHVRRIRQRLARLAGQSMTALC